LEQLRFSEPLPADWCYLAARPVPEPDHREIENE
jgi:hypothetical protein